MKFFLDDNVLYRKLIGKLLYLANHSIPDITASVNILSQSVEHPKQNDLVELKRVINYCKTTKNFQLHLSDKNKIGQFDIFSDANWGEDRKDRKSDSGHSCMMNGGPI